MMFMATKTVSEQITLQDIQFKDTMITIVGDTPLITNEESKESKRST